MNKREFIGKAGFLTASFFTIPLFGSDRNYLKGVKNEKNMNSFDDDFRAVPGERNEIETASAMNLVIGSDHAGFPLKAPLVKLLQSWDYSVKDVGSFTPDPVDFPDIAILLAEEILKGRAERGIMVCGTGVGAAIACNKIHGIRAALCHDTYSAHQCVEHDNVNVLCIGAQIIGPSIAGEILKNFLTAKFSTEEEFRRRVKKLDQFDVMPPIK
jgi:ribose 5-phosphate isomerase B